MMVGGYGYLGSDGAHERVVSLDFHAVGIEGCGKGFKHAVTSVGHDSLPYVPRYGGGEGFCGCLVGLG
jgi:hypothetical protein